MQINAYLWSFSTAILSGALAFGAGMAEAEDASVVLNVQGGWSSAGYYEDFEVPFWTEHLPEVSEGRITSSITSLDASGLKGSEVFRLMRMGVLDFGTSALGYVAGDDPVNEGPDLAGVALDIETERKVLEAYRPELEKLYQVKYGIKPLLFYPAEAQVFWCNAPIAGLDDLEGLKVRTGNRTVADFVAAAGATTVTMPFGEVVTSLERGVIDCAVTGTYSGNAAGWAETTTHLYPLVMGWSPFMYGANQRVWEELPADIQTLLTAEFAQFEDDLWAAAARRTEEGLSCSTGGVCSFGKPFDMTLVPVTPEDDARRQEIVNDVVVPAFRDRCGEACFDNWQKLVGALVDPS
ncbi:TRAP transporter substrate-binding protein [uncultured Sulfitobacter sp.]|uniref:TRAP transporter substrate-binding protein n=1 Tax=uncultured Sulfitobacter sp. TaxID=191468 RepID=UPI0025932F24|nr:TRAP transporter substrate-binding protein [uncultured Sulfitobacter sp.]